MKKLKNKQIKKKKRRQRRDIRRKVMHGARYLSSVSVRCTYTYLSTYLSICMKAALLYCLRRKEEANEKYGTVMAYIYISTGPLAVV